MVLAYLRHRHAIVVTHLVELQQALAHNLRRKEPLVARGHRVGAVVLGPAGAEVAQQRGQQLWYALVPCRRDGDDLCVVAVAMKSER
jgi:hypothetical protein